MKKIILLSIILLIGRFSLFSQPDSLIINKKVFGHTPCSMIIYSLYGLMVDGETFCRKICYNGKTHTYNSIRINENVEKMYPNIDFDGIFEIHECKYKPLMEVNGKILANQKMKRAFSGYHPEKVIESYYIDKNEAKKKYGWFKGRRGALIIRTE